MHFALRSTVFAVGIAFAGLAAAQGQSDREVNPNKIPHRINPGHPTNEAPTAGGIGALSPITNHGGPVMSGAPNVHLIFYGNWNQSAGSDTPAGKQIVIDFMNGVGGSNWMKINTATGVTGGAYTDGGSSSLSVSGNLGSVYSADVGYSIGKSKLTDANIASIVANYVNSKAGGNVDGNAIYFVLTSSDVAETSGFCSRYCGWHTKGTILNYANTKYSFVGNANRCLSGCAAQTVSPNNNPGVDGMVSVLAHELVETLSDPLLNAWYDSSGAENADKCAWTFGSNLPSTTGGAYYNATLTSKTNGATRNFLLQRNLAAGNSKCYVDGVTGWQ